MLSGMRWGGIALAAVLASGGVARGDDAPVVPMVDPGLRLEDAWPEPPRGNDLHLDQQLVDKMTEIGNDAGARLETASRQMVGLRIDGRHQRAHIRLLAGSPRYLTLRMDEDIHYQDGIARVASRLDLNIHGHDLRVQLPDVEMLPDAYQDSRYVEVRVPLFERRW